MLQIFIHDPRAWRMDTIDDRSAWYPRLSPHFLRALDELSRP